MKKHQLVPVAVPCLASALVLLVFLAGCQPSAPAATAPSSPNSAAPQAAGAAPGGKGRSAVVTVQAETVKFGPLMVQNSTAGTVVADTQSSVASQTTGTVLTLVRKAGDWVNAGAPVVRLDDSQLRLSLKIAQNNLETAKVNAGIGEKLPVETSAGIRPEELRLGSGAQQNRRNFRLRPRHCQANLESAKIAVQSDSTGVDTATLQVQQALLNLNYATIKAPFDGQIVSVNVQPGEYVTSSTTAFVMVSKAKDVDFNVPPSDVVGLTHGAKITFTQDGKTNPISLIGVPSAPVNGPGSPSGGAAGHFSGAPTEPWVPLHIRRSSPQESWSPSRRSRPWKTPPMSTPSRIRKRTGPTSPFWPTRGPTRR